MTHEAGGTTTLGRKFEQSNGELSCVGHAAEMRDKELTGRSEGLRRTTEAGKGRKDRRAISNRLRVLNGGTLRQIKFNAHKRFLERIRHHHPDTRHRNQSQGNGHFEKELKFYRFIMNLTEQDLKAESTPLWDFPLPWDWEPKMTFEGFQIQGGL